MLDLDDPLSEYIFAIAREDDAILSIAKRMTLVDSNEKTRLCAEALVHLGRMQRIASEGWGEVKEQSAAIDCLQQCVLELVATPSTNAFTDHWRGQRCTVCGTEIQNLEGYDDMIYCPTCLGIVDPGREAVDHAFSIWGI